MFWKESNVNITIYQTPDLLPFGTICGSRTERSAGDNDTPLAATALHPKSHSLELSIAAFLLYPMLEIKPRVSRMPGKSWATTIVVGLSQPFLLKQQRRKSMTKKRPQNKEVPQSYQIYQHRSLLSIQHL